MKLLVTGATGFLGWHLLPALAAEHELYALTRSKTRTAAPQVSWISADLSRPDDPWELPSHVDAVIYLAQSRRHREFPEGARDVMAVNVESFWRLVEYARQAGAQHFVFTSTGSVYEGSEQPLDEQAPLRPATFYATSKRIAEMTLEAYGAVLPATILRLFTLYGPGQREMLIPGLIDRIRSGRAVTLQGPDGLRTSPLLSIRELADAIAAVCGQPARYEQRAEQHAPGWIADSRRFTGATGWRPQYPLHEGLARTVAVPLRS
jgi:nucleoside-diphosphate-sugar epimerase